MNWLSAAKEWLGEIFQFAKVQLIVWLRTIRNPSEVLSEIDLMSAGSVFPALSLATFVWALSLLIALPKYFVVYGRDLSNPTFVIADLVITAIAFLFVGFFVFIGGIVLGGRGTLGASLLAGFYLSAYWPIPIVVELVLTVPGYKEGSYQVPPLLAGFIFVCLVSFWLVQVTPVMARVHMIGKFRGACATVIQGTLTVVAWVKIVEPLFKMLIGKPQ